MSFKTCPAFKTKATSGKPLGRDKPGRNSNSRVVRCLLTSGAIFLNRFSQRLKVQVLTECIPWADEWDGVCLMDTSSIT